MNKKKILAGISLAAVLGAGALTLTSNDKIQFEVKEEKVLVELGEEVSLDPTSYLTLDSKINIQDIEVSFSGENAKDVTVGQYELTFKYKDDQATINIEVQDTTAPVISGIKKIIVDRIDGEINIAYLEGVTATDLSKTDIEVDTSKVTLNVAGTYEITYIATDQYKNKTEEKTTITVKEMNEDETSTNNPQINQPSTGTTTTNPSTESSGNTGSSASNSTSKPTTTTPEAQIPSIAQVKEKLIQYGKTNGLTYDASITQKNVYSCIEPIRDSSNGGSLDCINLFFQILKTTETSFGLDVKEVIIDGKEHCSMTLIFPPKEVIITVTDDQVKQKLIDYGVALGLRYDASITVDNCYTHKWTEQMLTNNNGCDTDGMRLLTTYYKDKTGSDTFNISVETVARNGKQYRRMIAYYPW